jgi:hypothetical protein
LYLLYILPLIRVLKQEFPEVEQPWYADDAGAGGKEDAVRRLFHRLQDIGPSFGYFPEPTKSVLIVPRHNLESARTVFADLNFTVTTGHRYLGGFIGDQDAFEPWIKEQSTCWTEAVTSLASVAKNFPQSAYSGLQKLLQQEWQFVQRVRKDTGMDFTEVERTISQSFLPTFFGDTYNDDDPCRRLASLPVKHAGFALPNPTESTESNYEASTLACSHLVAALKGLKVFCSSYHLAVIREVRIKLQPRKDAKHDSILASIISTLSCDNCRTILRGQETGQWLSVMPSVVNGTQLLAQEYRDALLLHYVRSPADLQSR